MKKSSFINIIKINSILLIICIFAFSIYFTGCDVEEPFEVEGSVPTLDSRAFTALDFPSADGDSWEYVTNNGEISYTATISGTKNIAGSTVRILKTDANIPTDYTSAAFGFPIRYFYFTKDLHSYLEYGYDLWVEFLGESGDTYFQRYQPKRVAWSFPLDEGKEWIVSKSYTEPYYTYTRKVISTNENVSVPAGNFSNVFHIQESVSAEGQSDTFVIANYWLARGKGVIKYDYVDPYSDGVITYELRRFSENKR
ncbi:MAG: hypothetical protein ACPL7B_07825 [Candidatus Poribacteria bacterium]